MHVYVCIYTHTHIYNYTYIIIYIYAHAYIRGEQMGIDTHVITHAHIKSIALHGRIHNGHRTCGLCADAYRCGLSSGPRDPRCPAKRRRPTRRIKRTKPDNINQEHCPYPTLLGLSRRIFTQCNPYKLMKVQHHDLQTRRDT